jgi:hypothetical protein
LTKGISLFALFIFTGIWVITLIFFRVSFTMLESPDLKTSIASRRLWITVNQLLFREFKKLTSFNKVLTFNGSNGGEGPA